MTTQTPTARLPASHVEALSFPVAAIHLAVRVVVAAWIIFGAAMKIATASPRTLPEWMILAIERMTETPVQMEAWMIGFLQIVTSVELVAAGVILFVARFARLIAVFMLSVFLLVIAAQFAFVLRGGGTVAEAMQGSCGCFGDVHFPLWGDALVNLVLLALVIGIPANRVPLERMSKWIVLLLAGWVIVGVQFGLRTHFAEDAPEVVAGPSQWVGKDFYQTQLAAYCETDPDFYGGGEQTWILYRRTCSKCHAYFDEHLSGGLDGRVVVAVEIPAMPGMIVGDDLGDVTCPDCQFTRTRPDTDFLVNTPLIIHINDQGVIERIEDPLLDEFSKTHGEI